MENQNIAAGGLKSGYDLTGEAFIKMWNENNKS